MTTDFPSDLPSDFAPSAPLCGHRSAPSFATIRAIRGPSSSSALPPNYTRPTFTAAEAAEIYHNRPTPTHAIALKPGQSKPRSAIWPRSWARLRGDVAIVEIARGTAARERAALALGPRWEVVHTEHGGPFHGAISHPEFARALRAA